MALEIGGGITFGGGISISPEITVDYQISRSLRFNGADSANLARTPSVAGNRRTWTWSGWVKRTRISGSNHIFSISDGTLNQIVYLIFVATTNEINFLGRFGNQTSRNLRTTAKYRDTTAWMHIVFAFDNTQAVGTDRAQLYVNGEEITSFSIDERASFNQNYDTCVNNTVNHRMGVYAYNGAGTPDFYLAEVNFVDGQALAANDFGETDAFTGAWKPKAYTGEYGTNGFHLDFSDNSSTAALGYDAAGSNDWTPNNFSVTPGVGNDSFVDTPTPYGIDTGAGGEVRGNYCTWNPLVPGDTSVNGALDVTNDTARGTQQLLQYDAYWEITSTGGTTTAGTVSDSGTTNTTTIANTKTYGFRLTTAGTLDYINITDAGSWTNITSGLTGQQFPYASAPSGTTASLNAGQRPFEAAAPTGYKAICTQNLPEGTITTSGTFTGNGSTEGPFVYVNGVPTAMTIDGNAVTFGTDADKLANGFKLRSSSASYNATGISMSYSISSTGSKFKYANAQGNP
jgi:hypothetical protein